MAFSDTDPFLRTTLDSIGRLAQTSAAFKEINLRFSISRQDIYWRVRAADEYAHDFEGQSSKPVTEDRYYQETKSLFGFFTSALSALECFFFAAHFVGHAAVDPTKITADSIRGEFKRFQLVCLFKQHFPHDSFTQSLVTFIDDDEDHRDIRKIRNAISHRATPGRNMYIFLTSPLSAPHEWRVSDLISGAADQRLDKDFLLDRQDWLERTIRRLATELENFANARLPKT